MCVDVWTCSLADKISLTVCMCFSVSSVFQRGGQKVSWTALFLLLIGWTFAFISLFLAVAKQITWLDYLYYFSYIKLGVTLVKYVPQVSYTHAHIEYKKWKHMENEMHCSTVAMQ